MELSDTRRTTLEDRERWLVTALARLRRDIGRTPWLAFALLLMAPAWWLWGPLAAGLVAFTVVMVVGSTIYVAWSHVHECEEELIAVRRELRPAGARSEKQSVTAEGGAAP